MNNTTNNTTNNDPTQVVIPPLNDHDQKMYDSFSTHDKMIWNTERLQESPLVEYSNKAYRSPSRCNNRRGCVKLIDGYVFSDTQSRFRHGGAKQLIKDMKLVVEGEDEREKWIRENPA